MKSILINEYNPQKNGWEESVFHTANGYIGVRSCQEGGAQDGVFSVRGTYINGFYDEKDIAYGEKLYGFAETGQTIVNVTDVQTLEITIDGETFSLDKGTVLEYEHELYLDKGFQEKRIMWRSPSGKEAYIIIRRLASLVEKHLFMMSVRVVPNNFSGEVKIKSSVIGDVSNFADPSDPRVAAEEKSYLSVINAEFKDGNTAFIKSKTQRSMLELSCAVRHRSSTAKEEKHFALGNTLLSEYTYSASPNESITLSKYCVFVDSRRSEDTENSALSILNESFEHPMECFINKQIKYLEDFWSAARVYVDGRKLQRSMDYCLYSLLCSAGQDGITSVCAKGLSGEGYEGHYFWDTEIYIFPFFLLTAPEIAKQLLLYRYNILPKAREHAKIMGHSKGALYAWRSITGIECSAYYPSGSAQYHLTGDVAHAFIQYYLATEDLDFMRDYGAEVLIESARMWLDTGHYMNGEFRIDSVTGPDEYSCIVNNNYYTNCAAKENLLWAYKIVNILKKAGKDEDIKTRLNISEKELHSFKKAADNMYLPYDEELKINPQDDSFLNKKPLNLKEIPKENFPLLLHYHPLWLYRHQVLKQADTVLAHCLFEDSSDRETIKNSFEYYEKITTHDSSLSACAHSILASYLNDTEKALNYMLMSAQTDLEDTHKNTKDGIHTANMGGLYQSVVQGFAGLRIKESGLHLSPRLPKKWDEYAFNLYFKGRKISVKVNKKRVTLTLLEGDAINLYVFDEKIKLKDKEKINL
ncbi:MAG: glycosyl hydrolase family 65 protein [Eubacteriales bacterium]|nr:glycosyl hydrolase family 65 protein [Eubacteriales bacterium]